MWQPRITLFILPVYVMKKGKVRFHNLLLNYDYKNYYKFVKSSTAYAVNTTYVKDQTPPALVTGVSAKSEEYLGVTLTWDATTDNVAVTGYDVYRNGEKIATTSKLSYKDSELEVGEYQYKVVAFDQEGNRSTDSESVSIVLQKDTTAPEQVNDTRIT